MRASPVVALSIMLVGAGSCLAGDITVPLSKDASVERTTAAFRCDAVGVKLGLPEGEFVVEYITGGGNALAVLPIDRKPLVFANVIAADGARYAAGRFVWWDARGHSITLSAETTEGHKQSDCQLADKK